MADKPSPMINTHCPSCGRRLAFPAAAVGKKARCSSCHHVFTIEPTSTAVLPDVTGPGVEQVSGDRRKSLFDELADAESHGEAIQPVHEEGAHQAPADSGTHSRLGSEYVHALSESAPGLVGGAVGAAGPMVKGFSYSFTAMLFGVGLWVAAAKATGYELTGVAVLVGALAGLGMWSGSRHKSALAGWVAAGIAVFGVFLGKVLVFAYVLWPVLSSGVMSPDMEPVDTEDRREQVASAIARESLDRMSRDGKKILQDDEDRAYSEAAKKVAALSDSEVERLFKEGSRGTQPDSMSVFRRKLVGSYGLGLGCLLLSVFLAYHLGKNAFRP